MSRSSRSGGESIRLSTLAITALASAAAAYVTSKIWAPGTVGAAAMTPVLVALLKEALARPADVVTRAVPVRGVVRSAGGSRDPHGQPSDPLEPPEERVPQLGELPGPSRARRRRAWRAAVVTGLLGFLVAAVVLTVPELVAGESASGEGRKTTFFGGREKRAEREPRKRRDPAPGSTVTVPPAKTVTVPPARTVTAPPPQTTPRSPTTTATTPTTTMPAPEEPVPPPPPR